MIQQYGHLWQHHEDGLYWGPLCSHEDLALVFAEAAGEVGAGQRSRGEMRYFLRQPALELAHQGKVA